MVSQFLSLNLREFVKSFFVAFVGSVLMALESFRTSGTIPTTFVEWKTILLTGVSVGFSYVVATVLSGPKAANAEKQKIPKS